MKTTRIVLFLMVLSILWCADVFGHDVSSPEDHFRPGQQAGGSYDFGGGSGTFKGDPCEGTDCDVGEKYNDGHGHIDKYHDENDNEQRD